jgi:hypothetical protein
VSDVLMMAVAGGQNHLPDPVEEALEQVECESDL